MIEQRINKIQLKLKAGEAYLALTHENPLSAVDAFYLSGLSSSFAGILIGPDFSYYITHDLYFNDAITKLKGQFTEVINLKGSASDFLNQLIKKHDILKLKFSENISLKEHQLIKSLKVKSQKTNWLNQMRLVKSPDEIKLIDEACRISLSALEETKNIIKPGISENEIAAYLEWQMRKMGAESISFETIVASGQNGAVPHKKPTDKKLGSGELVTIDFGCKYQGYCSDITRTLKIGKINSQLDEIYNVVELAQQAGIESVKLNLAKTVGDVDSASRQVIKDAGYGEYFTHSTGHGIGLEVHELPHVSPNQTTKLKGGFVFTVEPGVYIPGLGGVRIEDCVAIEADGSVRVLGGIRLWQIELALCDIF